DGAHRADYARRRRRGPATRRVGTHTGYESSGRSHRRRNVRRIECVAACRDCWLILWSCRAGSPATPWFYAKVGRHLLLFLAWQYAGSADPQIFLPANHANCAKGFNSRLFVCLAGTSLPDKAADGHETPTNKQKETKTTKRNINGRKKYTFVCFVIFLFNRLQSCEFHCDIFSRSSMPPCRNQERRCRCAPPCDSSNAPHFPPRNRQTAPRPP